MKTLELKDYNYSASPSFLHFQNGENRAKKVVMANKLCPGLSGQHYVKNQRNKKMTIKIFFVNLRVSIFLLFRGHQNRAKNLVMTKNLVTKKLVTVII